MVSGEKLVQRLFIENIREERILLYDVTINMVKGAPWYGIGFGGFDDLFPASRPANLYNFFLAAHNEFLELALSVGIWALSVPVTILGASFWRFFDRGENSTRAIPAQAGELAILTLIYFESALDLPLHIPAIVYLTIILLAASNPSLSKE